MTDRWVQSPSGGIQVRATERGLPTGLRIDQREFCRTPADLARQIMLLCQLSARRTQVDRRRDLAGQGASLTTIRAMNLATDEDLAQVEDELYRDDEEQPDTWLKPV